ncbi:MAG: hypothetical protein ACI9SK_001627 [Zhongshania sp.]|jgi:hypothetical protein
MTILLDWDLRKKVLYATDMASEISAVLDQLSNYFGGYPATTYPVLNINISAYEQETD